MFRLTRRSAVPLTTPHQSLINAHIGGWTETHENALKAV